MAKIERKPKKKEVDEAMVDQIIAERQNEKNFKEKLYDKINIPVWVLDIVIVLLFVGLALVMIFGRTGEV